ncbi:hypothetical protein HCC18_09610 [Listeria booriae]|uniref:hypothetical protein n=1 Tax=Listeria booriae TaxID=1552123 RepID=UPI00162A4E02|nr:hypothetical protein [Listeria booriae]MBC2317107.1 hypothetical protein [Listeria booriae]
MRKLLTKLMIFGMVMALVISTIPAYSLQEGVSAATTDKPEKPTIKTYTNGPGTGTGYMDISWKAMPGATNYKIVISNGYNYEYFTTGNVTTWSTKGKKIFPTQAEINQGLYKFHTDGKGVEFATDPRALYENGYKAGSTHGLRNQQKYIVGVIPVYSTTDGVRSDIVDAYLPAEVQPEKAIAKTYSNGAGTGTGYIDLSWKAMPGATGYKVVIGNGYNYEYFTVGNVTSWSTKGKNIFPTKAELDKGLYRFHTDGKGTEFANDPTQLYENTYKAGTTWVLRGQKKYLIRVMAIYTAGDGVTSDITEATMPIEQMSTPVLTSHKTETDLKTGYLNVSWKSVPEAISYKVGLFNGYTYQYVDVGKVTTWSTKGKKLWATEQELNEGKYQLHTDGTGSELPLDPMKTYSNAHEANPNVNYSDRLIYYARVIAVYPADVSPVSANAAITMPMDSFEFVNIETNTLDKDTGEIYASWGEVEGAVGYKVWIYDGSIYKSIDVGNILDWTSQGQGIWPTNEEILMGNMGVHQDGSGTELAINPSIVYQGNNTGFANDVHYYTRITAYNEKRETIAIQQNPKVKLEAFDYTVEEDTSTGNVANYNALKKYYITNKTIKNVEELKNTIKIIGETQEINTLSTKEKQQLIIDVYAIASPSIIDEYEKSMEEEITNVVQSADVNDPNGELLQEETIKLSDGSDTTVSTEDVGEDTISTFGESLSPNYRVEKKNFGSRLFTVKISYTSWGVKVGAIVLSNHYTVNSKGLTMRYTSKAGTWGSTFWAITSASTKTTDKYAEKLNYNINGAGWYTIRAKGSMRYVELRSTITLTDLSLSKKYAYVVQKYQYVR